MTVYGLQAHEKKKQISTISCDELREFESHVAKLYEAKKIKGPIHLADGNEEQLQQIFEYISEDDWVFAAWRNHYHALLHGVDRNFLLQEIIQGRSMGIISKQPKFISSSIVGGIIPIALGVALDLKRKKSQNSVWCFIGDMTMETGVFAEAQKYSQNHSLPLNFVLEDNGKSVTSDTKSCWGVKMSPPKGVIHYNFTSKYPHHGTGQWVNF